MLSDDCLDWARIAGYEQVVDESSGITILRSAGSPTRYYIRTRGRGRLELSETTEETNPRPLLFTASNDVLERYLYTLFGDDVRDECALPFLELPWATEELASGYRLSDMQRGYRILSRHDNTPVAAAPDPVLSLVALVPLSHILGISTSELKASFRHPHGAPLLDSDGSYRQA